MSEKMYEFPGDYVLEVLNVANELFAREIVVEPAISPGNVGDGVVVPNEHPDGDFPRDGLAAPQPVLAYNPATGKFEWVWEIPPHMDEVTAKLLVTLPPEAFVGLDSAIQDWIDQVTDPRDNIAAGVQLFRLGSQLPEDLLAETGIRDMSLRLFDAGKARYEGWLS